MQAIACSPVFKITPYMKRFFFLALLSTFSGLAAQSGDSLQRRSQYHADASVYTMMPWIYDTKLEPYIPGFKLAYGVINQRSKHKFRDWEFSAGVTHLQSPMVAIYSSSDGNYPPNWTPTFLGYGRYKYHYGDIAFQYRFGHYAAKSKSDFYWSWGPGVQSVFLWSYKPLQKPSIYKDQPNAFGNVVVARGFRPALAVTGECGFLLGAAEKKYRYRVSFFGSVQLTPSYWDVSGNSSAFPVSGGLRAGIIANKKAVRDTSGNFLPQYPAKKRFAVYAEAGGPGLGISANLEVKFAESADRLFSFYGRGGVSYVFDSSPGSFIGMHTAIGRKKWQFDAGACYTAIDRENALVLSLGARYTGNKGFFFRPAFTPVFYSRILPWGGVSAGYTFSCKKKNNS